MVNRKETTSNDPVVADLTLGQLKKWSEKRRRAFTDAVRAGADVGRRQDETVEFEGKEYMIGYADMIIKAAEQAEQDKADAEAKKSEATSKH